MKIVFLCEHDCYFSKEKKGIIRIYSVLMKKLNLLLLSFLPTLSSVAAENQSAKKSGLETKTYTVGKSSFKMVYVEGGTFRMGSQKSNKNGENYDPYSEEYDESPVHSVTLSSFAIGETEVTQGLWKSAGMSASTFTNEYGIGDNYPVYNISFGDAQAFVDSLNSKLHRNHQLADDLIFALPTEAQWEYAARGGKKSKGYSYSGSSDLSDVGWYRGEEEGLQPVKTKKANELGIYDMSGNVYEWCTDRYEVFYYRKIKDGVTDPTGPGEGDLRTLRGGSWLYDAQFSRVSNRYATLPSFGSADCGMRVVLVKASR